MNKVAIHEFRPWEQSFWKPAPGKRVVLFFLLLIHILAVVGLILFRLPSMRILSFALLFSALGCFGTAICYHRMLAHRTLKVNKIIECLLIFLAVSDCCRCVVRSTMNLETRRRRHLPRQLWFDASRLDYFAKRKGEFLCEC